MEDSPDFIKLPASNPPDDGSQPSNNEHNSGVRVESNESTIIEEQISVLTENGVHKRNGSQVSNCEIDDFLICFSIDMVAIKRPRITVDEQQASVHVIYNSLTRESKQKLEELLQKWSEWHNRHQSSSHDSNAEVESGEGTYFPALNVGLDKPSTLSFWMDGQTSNLQSKEVIALDNNSVPLYDRGYTFGLTSTDDPSIGDGEMLGGSRCFNCGSYNHALKECTKPRDNAAVNSARKQHKSKRNQNSISRNPTRYYQDTPGGKFDGLRPGVLDSETRKLLGIGELDPPPWLNRMREIGYPPGYLDEEEEEQPSGIEIFGDEVITITTIANPETEDGEILDMDFSPPPPPTAEPPSPPPPPPPPKKMTVQFPGVNAPIPENADEWKWGARAWKFDLPRNRGNPRFFNPPETHHEERWNRGYREDGIGPPGVDGPLASRFTDYESRGSSHHHSHRSMSERLKRSHDDDRWNPYENSRKERHQEGHHRSWR
uniref:CCHC-type domain-containing protein n=1 Tax=Lactuca sativa TaxID=4236 RepID=A0A9R1VPS2_LACSA|nr:hypothetical protein LSAT_V11C400224010 [Lactuca sativa]